MSRTIEANFFPQIADPSKEKACILIIDNNRDFTHSAKLALERTGRYGYTSSDCELSARPGPRRDGDGR